MYSDAEVTSDDDDDSEDGCAPDGWRDMNDNTCDYFSSNEMCDFDYEHYAADGYHSAHCKECGCGAQKEEGNNVIFETGFAKNFVLISNSP